MKRLGVARIDILPPDRAGAAGQAAARATSLPGGGDDVVMATPRNETVGREGAGRTDVEARPRRARLARVGTLHPFRQRETLGEQEHATIGVPQPELRMDEDADRRGEHGVRAPRPIGQRRERRPLIGKQQMGAGRGGGGAEDAFEPVVQRVRPVETST